MDHAWNHCLVHGASQGGYRLCVGYTLKLPVRRADAPGDIFAEAVIEGDEASIHVQLSNILSADGAPAFPLYNFDRQIEDDARAVLEALDTVTAVQFKYTAGS